MGSTVPRILKWHANWMYIGFVSASNTQLLLISSTCFQRDLKCPYQIVSTDHVVVLSLLQVVCEDV